MITDVIIIGSGPAAYSSVLYIESKSIKLIEGQVVGGIGPGGQLTTTESIENFPGYTGNAYDFVENMQNHIQRNGNVDIISETVTNITKENGIFIITTNENNIFKAKAVILATGARARRLDIPGTRNGEFWQKGVTACAVCDGFLFRDEIVAIVGGGDSACEDALYLSNIASKVYVIHRRNEFRAKGYLVNKIKKIENVELLTPYVVEKAEGDKRLEKIIIKNTENNQTKTIETKGLFFAVGHIPNTQFLDNLDVKIDNDKYLITNENGETAVEGLFACGDVQDKIYRQAVTAASSGCIAALKCNEYLKNIKKVN